MATECIAKVSKQGKMLIVTIPKEDYHKFVHRQPVKIISLETEKGENDGRDENKSGKEQNRKR